MNQGDKLVDALVEECMEVESALDGHADQMVEAPNDKNVGTNIIRNAVQRMAVDLKLMKQAKAGLGANAEAKKAVKLIDKALRVIAKSL